jgi:hypothetical protein
VKFFRPASRIERLKAITPTAEPLDVALLDSDAQLRSDIQSFRNTGDSEPVEKGDGVSS